MLLLAHLEALAGQPTAAVELLQSAQATGGSIEHWRDSVALYAKLRASMRGGGESDALRALEGGVQLLQAVARWVLCWPVLVHRITCCVGWSHCNYAVRQQLHVAAAYDILFTTVQSCMSPPCEDKI